MNIFATRFVPGDDIRKYLEEFAKQKSIEAGFVITCVGSLSKATLRFAGKKESSIVEGALEIVSFTGTFAYDGVHFHAVIADEYGKTTGGHVKDGCIVRTTAEIVIGSCDNLLFSRELDLQTGCRELVIQEK